MARPRRVADALVVAGLARDHDEARALIENDRVTVNGAPVLNAARQVSAGDVLAVVEETRFVGRGGLKLSGALDHFESTGRPLPVVGARVLDLGASTGGFVDCLLQRGAAQVVACDVGRGLLHPRIAVDPRVEVRDGVNARDIASIVERGEIVGGFDLVVADLSFVSLKLVVGQIAAVLRPGGEALLLVKPQFEASKREVDRGKGVISDATVRRRCIDEVAAALRAARFEVVGEVESAIPGPAGNREQWIRASIV